MKLGVWKKNFKITAGRTVFRKSTPNLTITNGDFESNFEVLKKKKIKKPLKVPSLARSVPKPLLIFASQNIKRILVRKMIKSA